MKKIWKFVIGGIENKIFNLVLVTFLTVAAVYMSVIWFQSHELTELVSATNEKQQNSIKSISQDTMKSVIDKSLTRINNLQAEKIDETFRTLQSHVSYMNEYASRILGEPGSYDAVTVHGPDPAYQDMTKAQLFYSEGVDPNSASIKRKAGLIGNMASMMESLYNNFYNLNSCFIGTSDGIFLIVDEQSGQKFDENGKVMNFPVTDREWYTKAVEIGGGVSFSDIETDYFTDKLGIVCSMPVIIDGEVAAVVGADFFLDNMQETLNNTLINGGFAFIVNESGHVVMTADKNGAFLVQTGDTAEDLRKSHNQDLAEFITDAMSGITDVQTIRVGNETYYMCGSPMKTVGWTAISCMNKEVTDQPTMMMYYEYHKINDAAQKTFNENINYSRMTLLVLLIMLFLIGLANALVLSQRIVKPLSRMTKEIGSLEGENLQFKMKDSYRTGDEIQVLAESFAELSAKTLSYIDEVRTVTAENERIGAEMNLARDIQASQLPDVFGTFNDRNDFRIYAKMDPAKEVGGDFFDFFLIDEDHLGMVIADVSGKGVPAALFMMIAKALIKNRLLDGESPGDALTNVNSHLLEGNAADMFVTVWCAVVDLKTGEGMAANAGHEHPSLKKNGASFDLVKYRHSPALAMMDGIVFKQHSFHLDPGDTLFVYTDGVPEAENKEKGQFTTDRMLDSLNKDPDAEPQELIYTVANDIAEFAAGCDQFDDITMLCFRYNGPQTDDDKDDRIA